jgi:amidohydrolase
MPSLTGTNALKERVTRVVDSLAADLISIADDIHAHPEIRFEERYAAGLLTAALERAGFPVERGIAGLETAFRARFDSGRPGPTLAILGEYDALPEIGHACGHNLMGPMCVGAAVAVKTLLADPTLALGGAIIALGTPAEEGGGGKVTMVQSGIFDGVDAAMIVHPGALHRVHAASLASFKLTIRFHGKPAHAAASPQEGINALDALILTFNGINALRQHVTPDVRMHGIITKGGVAPNIVPDLAEGSFIIRATNKEANDKLIERVKDIARGAGLATGARPEFEAFGLPYEPMKSNSVLERLYAANLASAGVFEDATAKKGLGSTDMGNVSQVLPSIHPSVAIAPRGTPGHTREMAAAARSEEGHRGLILAAKTLAMTAIDLLAGPELVREAWEEFRRPTP